MIKTFLHEWNRSILALVIIVFLALFLRTYNQNALPVFTDEAIYVRWSQVMKAEPTLRFLPVSDGKQPLFMWTVMPVLKVLSDPLIAGRTVSAFTGMGTLFGIFVLTYLFFQKKKVALLAAFFYAVSPYSVFFDRMALVDSMLAMFGVWTFILGYITVQSARLDAAMITGFALGGALLTKSPAIFFVVLLPTLILTVDLPKRKKKLILHLTKLLGLYLVIIIIGYAMYNILRLGPHFTTIGSRNQDYIYPLNHIFNSPLDPFLPFVDRSLEWLQILGPGLLLLFIPLGLLQNLKKYWKELSILALWFVGPIFVVSEYARILTARYIYFTLPFAFILAALIALNIPKTSKGIYKKVIVGLIIILSIFALQKDYHLLTNPEAANLPRSERSGYLEEWTAGTGIREVSEFIRNEYLSNPNQKIVVGTEGYFGTLPDALQAYLNDIPEITVIGTGIDFAKIPSSLIESRDAGNTTYFVVNSSRIFFSEEEFPKQGLRIIKSYKKADRPMEIKEYENHGPYDKLYLLQLIPIVKE